MTPVRSKLLLDAHVSGQSIAPALRDSGHDVLAVDSERLLDGMEDEELLQLATSEERVLVTFNAKDFVPIVRSWAEAGKGHAGCIIFVGVRQNEFGVVIAALQRCVRERHDPDSWRDLTLLVGH